MKLHLLHTLWAGRSTRTILTTPAESSFPKCPQRVSQSPGNGLKSILTEKPSSLLAEVLQLILCIETSEKQIKFASFDDSTNTARTFSAAMGTTEVIPRPPFHSL